MKDENKMRDKKDKIKIVYCIDDLYSAGGMQRVLTMKANYLAEKLGYDVTILLTEERDLPFYYPLSPLIHIQNFDLNFYRMYNRSSLPMKIIRYQFYMKRYKRMMTNALMDIRPDITVSLLRKDINFINSIPDGSHKVGEIHFDRSNYRVFRGPLPQILCKWISRMWMKQLVGHLRKLERFVVLTNEDKDNWNELDNVICIHNPSTFQNVTQHSECTNKQVIAIGRYTYQKGIDLLLSAWKLVAERHPDWTLQVFGGGERTDYQQLVEELKIGSSCILNGDTKDIENKLIDSSIFVLSSRYEGMPMVLGEAMIHGVPPVSFACPCGPRDIITDGVDGLLVENGNVQQLAEKICLLIEQEKIRRQIGEKAKESIKQFDIEKIMPKWDRLFKSIIS